MEEFIEEQIEKKSKISLYPSFSFKRKLIRQTIFSISDNENTKLMTGELFEVKDDQLSVVSLDGHRISIRHIELKDHYDPFKVVVPGKTLQEIVKIISGEMDEKCFNLCNFKTYFYLNLIIQELFQDCWKGNIIR